MSKISTDLLECAEYHDLQQSKLMQDLSRMRLQLNDELEADHLDKIVSNMRLRHKEWARLCRKAHL